jgi:hypothetical protein
MNTKKYFLAVGAVFITLFVINSFVHGFFLADEYRATEDLWRSQSERKMLLFLFTQFLFSASFVFIFTRNFENKGIDEGIRYGTYVGLLLATLEFGKYCHMPIGFDLALSWMFAAFFGCAICGAVASIVYKD